MSSQKRIVKRYKNINGTEIDLEAITRSNNSLELTIYDQDPSKQTRKIKKIVSLVVFLICFSQFLFNFYLITVVGVILAINIISYWTTIKSENVTIIRQLGLQKSTKYALGRSKVVLIPMNQIQDVAINEVFHNQRVIFLLQVFVINQKSGKLKIVPLFENIHPNLECLEFVYKSIKNKLNH